ncbi:hypothetical protein ACF0H5_023986 [Mactra antiquata]
MVFQRKKHNVLTLLFLIGYFDRYLVSSNNCTITEMIGNNVETKLVRLKSIHEHDFPTDINSDHKQLEVSMCPDNTTLKIVTSSNNVQEGFIEICYIMNTVFDGRHLETKCYHLHLNNFKHQITVSCWFPMKYFKDRPNISVWVTVNNTDRQQYYTGSLNTALLDPRRPCGNICEISVLSIPRVIYCQHTHSIQYEDGLQILNVNISPPVDGQDELNITQTTIGKIEYSLDCSHSGSTHIKVLYLIRDQYCLKYQLVQVICPDCNNDTTISALKNDHIDDGASFGMFLMYGVCCFFVTTVICSLIVAVVQCKHRILKICRRFNEDFEHESLPMNSIQQKRVTFETSSPELIPCVLKTETGKSSHPVVTTESNTKTDDSKITSAAKTTDATKTNNATKTSGTTNAITKTARGDGRKIPRLQRSATMALLEVTDPMYRKKVLLLPSVWDLFSRNMTDLLKQLFTKEAGVTAQCCYDRDVHQQYFTSDKYKWIEHILGDRDKIIVLLCFTNLDIKNKRSDNIDMCADVVSQLHQTKNISHIFCKVIYLHLTDSSAQQLARSYHGDSYRLNTEETFGIFLRDVMTHCGLNPNRATALVQTLIQSGYAQGFLSYIGLK